MSWPCRRSILIWHNLITLVSQNMECNLSNADNNMMIVGSDKSMHSSCCGCDFLDLFINYFLFFVGGVLYNLFLFHLIPALILLFKNL